MKKDNSKATQASWSNPEEKKKSLAEGRAKSYKAKKSLTGLSFDKSTIEKISINKYKAHCNYLALYLIEKSIDITEIKRLVSKLNKPQNYKHKKTFDYAIEKLLKAVNTEDQQITTQEKVKELIAQGVNDKPIRKLSREESKRHYKRDLVRLLGTLSEDEMQEVLKYLQRKYKTKDKHPKQ